MKKWNIYASLLVLGALLISPAQAATVTFNLSTVFSSGAVAPDGPAPYATVELDDGGGVGTVQMTLSVSGSVGIADLTQLYLNLDPGLDPTLLTFNFLGLDGPAASGISTGVNAFMSDGDGAYDILFDFPTAQPDDRLSAGETVVYQMQASGITASSFNFLSAEGGGEGTYLAASKWQSTGPGGLDSAWVGASVIPVPAAVWLFGSGLIGLIGVARRRKK